ncbi:MAG: hypothetical protein R3C59_05130 [Planctomycetaceae bacterium]
MIRYLERHFGRFAVPFVTQILIAGQILTYMATQRDPQLFERMLLIPAKVMDGEAFRLLTFAFMPPGSIAIWAFFFWYLFYIMGTALEAYWGTFRFNLFLLIGYVATVAAAFVNPDGAVTNWFIQGTVFLAFAHLNPNFTLSIFFILPVRIKWLAMFTWIAFGWSFLTGTWSVRLAIAASVLNFFVFFGGDVWYRIVHGQRHMLGQARRFAVSRPPEYFHKCAVCGITDTSHPQTEFRYCSRCSGDLGYCPEHLRDHEHVTNDDMQM